MNMTQDLEKVIKTLYNKEGIYMNDKKVALLLGFMCFVLVIAICVQINTVNNSYAGVAKTKTENELRDSVLKLKEKYDSAYALVEKNEKEIEILRQQALTSDENAEEIKTNLEQYDLYLGKTDVKGPGIIITVADADLSGGLRGDSYTSIVHDEDLVEIVNALKNAGAEAISINGERITNTTAITCIGNVVKINGEKVGSPFEIKAIGLTAKLYGSLTMPYGYIDILKRDGVQVTIEQVEKDTIVIPKFNGVYKFEYAKDIEQ